MNLYIFFFYSHWFVDRLQSPTKLLVSNWGWPMFRCRHHWNPLSTEALQRILRSKFFLHLVLLSCHVDKLIIVIIINICKYTLLWLSFCLFSGSINIGKSVWTSDLYIRWSQWQIFQYIDKKKKKKLYWNKSLWN